MYKIGAQVWNIIDISLVKVDDKFPFEQIRYGKLIGIALFSDEK